MILRAEMTPRKDQNHRIDALQFAQTSIHPRVIGQVKIRKLNARLNIFTHALLLFTFDAS